MSTPEQRAAFDDYEVKDQYDFASGIEDVLAIKPTTVMVTKSPVQVGYTESTKNKYADLYIQNTIENFVHTGHINDMPTDVSTAVGMTLRCHSGNCFNNYPESNAQFPEYHQTILITSK